MRPPEGSLYARVGGEPWFVELVERFYEGVEADPALRPLYPADLEPGKTHLAAFLAQYWGGPPVYQQERGHPRLRQRHLPFAISSREAAAWLAHMSAAVRSGGLTPADQDRLLEYFGMATGSLVNTPSPTNGPD